jgi:hypothetical protein
MFQHIIGHQDQNKDNLSPLTILNVQASNLRSKAVKDIIQAIDKAVCQLGNKQVVSHYKMHIQHKYSATQFISIF